MSNYIFIQTSSLNNDYLEKEFELFSAVPNTTIVPFGIIPFTSPSIITGLDDFVINKEDTVFIRGGTLLATKNFIIPNNVRLTQIFKNNIYHNNFGFDYKTIHYYFDSNNRLHKLLNSSIKFAKCIDIKDVVMQEDTFFKPTTDLKDFGGLIVKSGNTLEQSVSTAMHKSNWQNCEVMYTTDLVEIIVEYRFFFVNNTLITGSRYIQNQKLSLQQLSESDLKCAESWLKGYVPDSSFNFVVDVAKLADNTYKIIEYNCLNCSGLYAADVLKLVAAIQFEFQEY